MGRERAETENERCTTMSEGATPFESRYRVEAVTGDGGREKTRDGVRSKRGYLLARRGGVKAWGVVSGVRPLETSRAAGAVWQCRAVVSRQDALR
jgi:hypothetical protein